MSRQRKERVKPPIEIFGSADARRVWVKGQLELIGESYATIARELGVTRHAVARALFEPRHRMEKAISEKLGLAPSELFPERYLKGLYSSRRGAEKQEEPESVS